MYYKNYLIIFRRQMTTIMPDIQMSGIIVWVFYWKIGDTITEFKVKRIRKTLTACIKNSPEKILFLRAIFYTKIFLFKRSVLYNFHSG